MTDIGSKTILHQIYATVTSFNTLTFHPIWNSALIQIQVIERKTTVYHITWQVFWLNTHLGTLLNTELFGDYIIYPTQIIYQKQGIYNQTTDHQIIDLYRYGTLYLVTHMGFDI